MQIMPKMERNILNQKFILQVLIFINNKLFYLKFKDFDPSLTPKQNKLFDILLGKNKEAFSIKFL
jgi:hypothetical protein